MRSVARTHHYHGSQPPSGPLLRTPAAPVASMPHCVASFWLANDAPAHAARLPDFMMLNERGGSGAAGGVETCFEHVFCPSKQQRSEPTDPPQPSSPVPPRNSLGARSGNRHIAHVARPRAPRMGMSPTVVAVVLVPVTRSCRGLAARQGMPPERQNARFPESRSAGRIRLGPGRCGGGLDPPLGAGVMDNVWGGSGPPLG
jgi:hypothetical protein